MNARSNLLTEVRLALPKGRMQAGLTRLLEEAGIRLTSGSRNYRPRVSLDGFEVVALNVTKLRSDNIDPRDYMQRLEDWKVRVEASGGQWRVINDLDRLDPAFLG